MTLFHEIDNEPRDYAWGQVDGVSRVRGTAATGRREAELWLGAHPSLPSRAVGSDAPWATLQEWEQSTGERLPFLLKILCADEPLSLQAHPSPAEAAAGFARENAAGVPVDAPNRNYRDPYAKPELIVALGEFEALCGFRAGDDVRADLDALGALVPADAQPALSTWRELLAGDDVKGAFLWLLSGDASIPALVTAAVAASERDERFALLGTISEAHPGDPGILGALMLQHIVLAPGESLWLPAGNIHAYLRGAGIELMGPSDNVLRGGLTPKHIDTAELAAVLDPSAGGDHRLIPAPAGDGVTAFRPDGAGFALYAAAGDATLDLPGVAIALATDGEFVLAAGDESVAVPRGRAVFVAEAVSLRITGSGRLFVATAA